ncbi:MAG TPA: RIO1 family regulatory kinase/ATPase [Streptosporangiaceae bacterium]|nr:RIO1 family regulatory kinase/ATPase [Streptosporangiaceae bacterium]
MPSSAYHRRSKWRFEDNEATFAKRDRHKVRLASEDTNDSTDGVIDGDRWSTWDQSSPTERGPLPYPDWLVTDLAATDTELGILKTGKEADVFLLRRGVPGTDSSCLLAAKRYRSAEHRQFHRDSEYLDGRRVRESRVNRAMAARTAVGKAMIAEQWAVAEFAALCQLHSAGVPVPYPVQIIGTEILLEFIGDDDGSAAPRLAELRPSGTELVDLWDQLVQALRTLAFQGLVHGDLSAFNLLVHEGRLVLIDLPQVLDVIAHPRGSEFLERDVVNVTNWFAARGFAEFAGSASVHPDALLADLRYEARLD